MVLPDADHHQAVRIIPWTYNSSSAFIENGSHLRLRIIIFKIINHFSIPYSILGGIVPVPEAAVHCIRCCHPHQWRSRQRMYAHTFFSIRFPVNVRIFFSIGL